MLDNPTKTSYIAGEKVDLTGMTLVALFSDRTSEFVDYCDVSPLVVTEDTTEVSNLMADIMKCINTFKSDAIMNGFDDAGWNKLQSDLESYRLSEFLEIHQKYLDQYLAS